MSRNWTEAERLRQRAQLERVKPGAKRWKRYSAGALGAALSGFKVKP